MRHIQFYLVNIHLAQAYLVDSLGGLFNLRLGGPRFETLACNLILFSLVSESYRHVGIMFLILAASYIIK